MSNTHPNCRFPSCQNTNSFIQCEACRSVWYCSSRHAQLDSSRHRGECYAAALEREHLLLSLARNILYKLVGYIALQRWYLKKYSWTVTISNTSQQDVRSPHVHLGTPSSDERWEMNISRIMVICDLVRMGGALSLPLPIALLQLPAVFGSTTLRTVTILAFLFAASSIIVASIFTASRGNLTSAAKRERWIDASTRPKILSSIDFWTSLSWPVTSFVWSIVLSFLALTSLAVTNPPDPGSVGAKELDVATTLITFLVVKLICLKSYSVFKFLWSKN